jgi:hypothetical protein
MHINPVILPSIVIPTDILIHIPIVIPIVIVIAIHIAIPIVQTRITIGIRITSK